ncbi:hypothetical protein E3N88_15456 [Mikania micrantha]|uniref:Uncharacterized protein n=1 Tax=Mikania micrantha TaxID=192012 RepID=A0A5N6NY90_9ASTR|nr:hypothetical protein E3N88_15456 [Mikania micrantha]
MKTSKDSIGTNQRKRSHGTDSVSLTESCESFNRSQSCAIQELGGAVKASTGFNLTCDRFERRRGAVKVPVGLNLE